MTTSDQPTERNDMSTTIPEPSTEVTPAKAWAHAWVADAQGRKCEVDLTLKDGMVEVVTRSDLGLPVVVYPSAIRG